MRSWLLFCTIAILVTTLANSGVGKESAASVDDDAPTFVLQDQNGKLTSLGDLLKHANVALVFHRSANW